MYTSGMVKSPNDYTTETLIKRVMSGKKEYRTNDYLTAFSKISASDLHCDTLQVSRFEMIKLWNSLQNTPNKVRYFTFSLTQNCHSVSKRIEEIYKNDKYAYICHDKDKSAEHKHFHFLLIFDSPRSFKSIANDLEIPVTMFQKVYSKKGMLDYLTHENDPNKHHYDLSEIHANFDVQEEKDKDENGGSGKIHDFKAFYYDYRDFRLGKISIEDFLDKYKSILCDISCTSAFGIADRVFTAEFSNSCTGASLSSRSECRVRTSVPTSPIQSCFSEIFPNKVAHLGYKSDSTKPVSFGNPDYRPPKPQKIGRHAKPNPRSDLSDVA